MTLAASAPQPRYWTVRGVLAPAVAVLMAIPLNLGVGDVDLINAIAQAIAVLCVFLILPGAILRDVGGWHRGSSARLLVLIMAVSSAISWLTVAVRSGWSMGALLSLLNWISLGGLVLLGQVLLNDVRRLSLALNCWVTVQALVAAAAVAYLCALFGLDVFLAGARAPFQLAMQEILPNWPNGAGLVFAVSACMAYGQMRGGNRGLFRRVALATLVLGTLVTFSRAAWLACFGGLALITLVGTRLRRSVPLLLGLVVVTVLIASRIPTVRYQFEITLQPGSSEQLSVLQRVAFAVEAFRLWRERPVVGIGFGRFTEYASLARLSAVGTARADYVPGSVHNEYLSTLLKGGLLSAMTFALFVWATWRHHRCIASRTELLGLRRWGLVGLGVATALLLGGLGGESFRQVSVSAPYWLLAGALSVLAPAGATGIQSGARARALGGFAGERATVQPRNSASREPSSRS